MNHEMSSKTIKSKVASHGPECICLKLHPQSRSRETMETMGEQVDVRAPRKTTQISYQVAVDMGFEVQWYENVR